MAVSNKYKYTDEEIKTLYPESQQLLEKDTPFEAMIFARDTIKSRWKAAEDFAVKWYDDRCDDPDSEDWRDLYPEDIADCWVGSEGYLRPDLDSFMSCIVWNYLCTVPGEGDDSSSWPEAEHIISTNPCLAAGYADPNESLECRSSREEHLLTRVFDDICSDSYEPVYYNGGQISPAQWLLEYWENYYQQARWPELERKLDDFIDEQFGGSLPDEDDDTYDDINELIRTYVKSIDWSNPKNGQVPNFLTKLITGEAANEEDD